VAVNGGFTAIAKQGGAAYTPPTMSEWSPSSWQRAPKLLQHPEYEDRAALDRVMAELSSLPPLVTSWEVEELRRQLAEAARGERFLLQGGDCAERFDECGSEFITNKLKILLQMSLVLTHGMKKRIVRVGRIAGQYAKPRSSPTEAQGGVELPTYRGDIVNRAGFSAAERAPDPELLLRAYERAGLTLNFIRSLMYSGFADLHHHEYWNLGFKQKNADDVTRTYSRVVEAVRDAVQFMDLFIDGRLDDLHHVDVFTSHEALLLYYEQAQTRRVPRRSGWFNLATHFPWIGMRTALPGSAHVEYMRGIENPIAIKIGPSMTSEWLTELLDILDPHRVPGRITLIHRFGVDKISAGLPRLIGAVRKTGRTVLWVSDPMHGNTRSTPSGYKTRHFDDILRELELAFDVHAAEGSHLGGVHFEMTGEDVTECIGGMTGPADESELATAFRSHVDPRLNYEQALEMSMLIAQRESPKRRRSS
jgi:3-deoxy-7-phosphoheptulonate synthase